MPGLDVYVHADLPMARGLSSSASVQSVALYGLACLLDREVSLEEFVVRKDQAFWRGLRELLAAWDERIEELNARAGYSSDGLRA